MYVQFQIFVFKDMKFLEIIGTGVFTNFYIFRGDQTRDCRFYLFYVKFKKDDYSKLTKHM